MIDVVRTCRQPIERIQELILGFRIDGTGRLVKYQNRRVQQQCPRDRQPLPFAPESIAPRSPSTVS